MVKFKIAKGGIDITLTCFGTLRYCLAIELINSPLLNRMMGCSHISSKQCIINKFLSLKQIRPYGVVNKTLFKTLMIKRMTYVHNQTLRKIFHFPQSELTILQKLQYIQTGLSYVGLNFQAILRFGIPSDRTVWLFLRASNYKSDRCIFCSLCINNCTI